MRLVLRIYITLALKGRLDELLDQGHPDYSDVLLNETNVARDIVLLNGTHVVRHVDGERVDDVPLEHGVDDGPGHEDGRREDWRVLEDHELLARDRLVL